MAAEKRKAEGKALPKKKAKAKAKALVKVEAPPSRRSTQWVRVVGMMTMMRKWKALALAAPAELKSRFSPDK